MCGFVGKINFNCKMRAFPDVPITNALLYLKRRGPDSWKSWKNREGTVELLHTRLAIVDQDERAIQPFSDNEGRYTIVFNGEIYNYEQLKHELKDYTFRTNSDTEVLLALFAKRGVEGLKCVQGVYTSVIVDQVKNRVYLARDPIGKKPLFIARWQTGVFFGSSVLALVAIYGGSISINEESLINYWHDSYIPPDKSIILGCRPLMPGEVIEYDFRGTQRSRSSCTPKIELRDVHSFEEAATVSRKLIQEAVTRRLHNNPNPVSLLSGGIDSTIVTQKMVNETCGVAVTLQSFIPYGMDEKYARYAAKRMGLQLELVSLPTKRLGEDILWAIGLQDEPLAVFAFFPLAMLVRKAKEYSKIVLTGDGADEVFLGYGKPNEWQNDTFPKTNAYVDTSEVPMVGVPAPKWMSCWGRKMIGHSLLGHMLPKLDRATAEQGVEARCPLLDWDLLAFARMLPPKYLFFSGRSKALLKEELAEWPRWYVERKKMGFPYHLRWAWGCSRYAGLRDLVRPESVSVFGNLVPAPLRMHPHQWTSRSILRNFDAAWKLLVWSHFENCLSKAQNSSNKMREIYVDCPGDQSKT